MTKTSLVLLSGGLDSCTALAIADIETMIGTALTITYGQRHVRELQSAKDITRFYKVDHTILDIPLGSIIKDATALINAEEELPHNRSMEEMQEIPRSYVPGRNTIMLACAQSIAEAYGFDCIYTGFNAVDYSGYPDCRPEYVDEWNNLAALATKRGVEGSPIKVVAPIISFNKREIVETALRLGAPLPLTWSCYKGGDQPCGECDSCIIRYSAFEELGMDDPGGPYAKVPTAT